MKLDKRIIEGKKPLTCFDTEEAKQFLGKRGYFNNNLSRFCYLKNCTDACLKNIFVQNETCFTTIRDDYPDTDYKYFLPAEWVKEKEPEPVWKPYDLDSWRNDNFRIGSAITFRIKPKNEQDSKNLPVKTMIYLGREERSDDLDNIIIYIGTIGYSFQYLFENYEIFDDKYAKSGCPKWRPFGYQE